MPNSNELPEAEILRELDTLESLLPSASGREPLSALVRILSSSPGSGWPELLKKYKLDQWLFLPLEKDKFPALEHLRSILSSLSFQKDHDPLTGLRNRRAFDQSLALEVERASRFKTPISLAILDIDNFKSINDRFGHPVGDKTLEHLAVILKNETRKIDTPARIGGEEFALILPGTGLARGQKLLQRILDVIRTESVPTEHGPLTFTCSVGLASYRGKSTPQGDTLYKEADKALYLAKKTGKNKIECAPLLDLGPALDQTLVQQNEKRFLFS